MDTRARLRLLARGVAMTAALGALAVPATAGAAATKKSLKQAQPVVTKVLPLEANVGDTLTIYGKNFRRGKARNSVAFKAIGQKAIFVTADISTRKQMKVVLPKKLEETMVVRAGALVPTKFKLRVLAKRFAKRFTLLADSPTVGPEPLEPGAPGGPAEPVGPPAAEGDCDGDGIINGNDTDDDGDSLVDGVEQTILTDQCNFDTDGDGAHDGYEYRSAVDLNDDNYQRPNESLPYPAKRPYPNPLEGSDAQTDHDGDGLTLLAEYKLWQRYGNPSLGVEPASVPYLYYSAGARYSLARQTADGDAALVSAVDYADPAHLAAGIPGTEVGSMPRIQPRVGDFLKWAGDRGFLSVNLDGDVFGGVVDRDIRDFNLDGVVTDSGRANYLHTEKYWFDFNEDNKVSDDERDEDADGLTNYDEARGAMRPGYWTSCYLEELPYQIEWSGTDPTDSDSDGDSVRDGADDQDFDQVPNLMELSRNMATGRSDWQQLCTKIKGYSPADADPTPEHGYRNPFNPCLPDLDSPSCPVYQGNWAPYGENTPNYFVLQ